MPTLEEIETAERRRALEMPMSNMSIGELRDIMIGDTSVQVRRLAVAYFENAAFIEGIREGAKSAQLGHQIAMQEFQSMVGARE